MNHFSATDRALLSALTLTKQDQNIQTLISYLRGMEPEIQKAGLAPLLDHLLSLNVIKISPLHINEFIIKNVILNKESNIKLKIFPPLYSSERKGHFKFEVRFFWPVSFVPDVYDINCLVFDPKEYLSDLKKDTYLLIDEKYNIKLRKDEIQFKRLKKKIGHICQFYQKEKLKFPLTSEDINILLKKKFVPEFLIFQTAEDLLLKLSEFFDVRNVNIIKKRNIRKIENITIEISLIKIQGQEWKTICIESSKLETLQALALLINQANSLALSYNQFLNYVSEL